MTESFLQGKPIEIALEFCRQVGKTESVADWLAFMFRVGAKMCDKKFKTIVFAPTREQARNDFTRFKLLLSTWKKLLGSIDLYENTKTKIEDYDGNAVSVLPLTDDVDIEGASGNFLIYEEAQGITDTALENKAAPMGANFGAPQIFVGTAGTKICKFYELIAKKQAFLFDYKDVAVIKEKKYEQDKNPNHLKYMDFVKKMRATQNKESFERQFLNKWNIGESQFMTIEQFEACSSDTPFFSFTDENLKIIWSLDQARSIDGAVLKKTLYSPVSFDFESVETYFLPENSYAEQKKWLQKFMIGQEYDIFIIDTTGNQTALPDILIDEGILEASKVVYFSFTATSKHEIFSLYEQKIRDKKYHFYNPSKQERYEHIMLQKKYSVAGLMQVEAPKKKGYHDDIPCTCAMSVYAGLNLSDLVGASFNIG